VCQTTYWICAARHRHRGALSIGLTADGGRSQGAKAVSENYRFYAAKMAELGAYRSANQPLQSQFDELMSFVKTCEEQWESRLLDEGTPA
jgi:hypothetical protein